MKKFQKLFGSFGSIGKFLIKLVEYRQLYEEFLRDLLLGFPQGLFLDLPNSSRFICELLTAFFREFLPGFFQKMFSGFLQELPLITFFLDSYRRFFWKDSADPSGIPPEADYGILMEILHELISQFLLDYMMELI